MTEEEQEYLKNQLTGIYDFLMTIVDKMEEIDKRLEKIEDEKK